MNFARVTMAALGAFQAVACSVEWLAVGLVISAIFRSR